MQEVTMMTASVPASTTRLAVKVSHADGRAAVVVRGELDATTAPLLYEEFAELSRAGKVLVDLDVSQLELMDSSGLSVVVAEHRRAQASGGELVIHNPNRKVIRLFQLHGLMSYLVVKPRMST
jgi:anti-sigma B factor antagonist